MRFEWGITEQDTERVKSFITAQSNTHFVQARSCRNLSDSPRAVSREEFWKSLITCLLTTQQRSGPESATSRFIRQPAFPLCYASCKDNHDLQPYAQKAFESFGGIRRSKTIAEEISENLRVLECGFWGELIPLMENLNIQDRKRKERVAARLVSRHLKGIGPKQSRNLLQMLGLTRYEIPIDSRIVKWLRKFRFPVPLSASCLSDPDYYEFIMDGIQTLCERCDVFPCILDACIFSSFDGDGWNEENIIY